MAICFATPLTPTTRRCFDSLRLLIRYEESLTAWSQILLDPDNGEIKNTLVMDYIHPVFRTACDVPIVFKDQLVRACVKLAALSRGDDSYLSDADAKGCPVRRNWFKEMKKICLDSDLGSQLFNIIDYDLYRSSDVAHFRTIHGHATHDLSPTLIAGLRKCSPLGKGITGDVVSAPFDLSLELSILDRQRLRIQNAYRLFGDYADELQIGD